MTTPAQLIETARQEMLTAEHFEDLAVNAKRRGDARKVAECTIFADLSKCMAAQAVAQLENMGARCV